MISRNLYLQIIFRICLVLLLCLLVSWMVVVQSFYLLSVIPLILLIIVVVNLIRYLNSTNRRLHYFFEAIKNEDSTLLIPEYATNRTLRDLNESLIKVNDLIHQIQVENRQQEKYFQALLEHAAAGIITLDKKGFVLHSNSSVRKLLSLDVLTHVNQLEKVDRKLFQAVKNIKPPEQKLVTIDRPNNNVQVLIKANSFISDEKELLLLSVQDIKNELDEKELDSWKKLIRVLMHEIMNAITPITSLSESLAGYFYRDGRMKSKDEINEKTIETTIRGLEVIREQGQGLISFVESYRKLTRLPKPDKKVFPAHTLIDNIRILSSSLENADMIEMRTEVKPENLEIMGDEKMLSQVLINLVKNAFQANGNNKNAKVVISARLSDNGRPEIRVADNGPGIDADLMDKIFIPFFTTKESGSGIGLSISRQIMLLHGGTLKISSIPGKLTTALIAF